MVVSGHLLLFKIRTLLALASGLERLRAVAFRIERLCFLLALPFKAFKWNPDKSKKNFRDFHYTPHDQFLFWVAGYTRDNNTSNLDEKVSSLIENAQEFADKVGCRLRDVQTFTNNAPPRYQYMRAFYIKTDKPHPDAFVWGFGDPSRNIPPWTMGAVLTH